MKKIAIALTALAGIAFLSGCAYDDYGYYNRYAFDYGYSRPFHRSYFIGGSRFDCLHTWNASFCG